MNDNVAIVDNAGPATCVSLYLSGAGSVYILIRLSLGAYPPGINVRPMPPDSISKTELLIEVGSEAVSGSPRGSIEISHGQVGLESWVTIKLPVPAFESGDEAQRRAEVLARARKLVDLASQQPSAKFVWRSGPIEPASKEALDANAIEGTRWTFTMEDRQEK